MNERLREVLGASAGAVEFVCECSNEDCIETIPLDLATYEDIRSNLNLFVITPGHELLHIERVVDQNERYLLVEKTAGADFALETDLRTRGDG